MSFNFNISVGQSSETKKQAIKRINKWRKAEHKRVDQRADAAVAKITGESPTSKATKELESTVSELRATIHELAETLRPSKPVTSPEEAPEAPPTTAPPKRNGRSTTV